jgi:TolB-like protein/Tfp pilus assembly protein PilF
LDDNLNTAVRKLRLALNDSALHPSYIETIPKRGYRFIAPVLADVPSVVPSDAGTSLSVHSESPASLAPRPLSRLAIPLAIFMIAAVIFFVAWTNSVPEVAAPTGTFNTIAVLPFVNESSDPENRYFSDGLSEEIMDRLSRSKRLRVVSRTSAFSIERTNLDARKIGRLLGADALVEGSVRRDADRVRINVRLVDASNGYQLWSESYDRRLHDLFAVQTGIAQSIENTLTSRLLDPGNIVAKSPDPIDPVAYDHYLQGRFYWHRRNEEGLRAAIAHFDTAIQLAPDYAPAWAGLADAFAVSGFYDYLAPEDAFPEAKKAATRALVLEPDNADAEATLGYAALYFDWDLGEAETRFRKSIKLNPDSSKAHQWYANLLTAAGRFDEAEREMRKAQQLDPLSLIASAALGWVRYFAGRDDEALDQLRLALSLDSNFELAYLWSGWVLESQGKYGEAIAMVHEAVSRSGGSGISVASLARVHALKGERVQAERLLDSLQGHGGYLPAYEIAKAYYALGENDRAIDLLQQAFGQRSHSLVFLRVDPQLSSARNSDDFKRLVEQVLP